LLIRKPNARDPSTYRDFRVRKAKVLRFLHFLKANNPFYAHIEIRQPDDVDLPIDGNILDQLPVVESEQCRASSNSHNDSHEAVEDLSEQSFEPEELTQEQNCFLPSPVFGQSELEAVSSAMRSKGLTTDCPAHERAIPWPTMGDPLSEFSTEGLFSKAFPALFPLGLADFSLPREKQFGLLRVGKALDAVPRPPFCHSPPLPLFCT
jgi:hypothetical protein